MKLVIMEHSQITKLLLFPRGEGVGKNIHKVTGEGMYLLFQVGRFLNIYLLFIME